jgi:Deacetylases, including yeast histone deacetylase and acetoin utilization protein
LKDFPEALAHILNEDNVSYYDGVYAASNPYYVKPATEEMLMKVHSEDMIQRVKRSGYYEAALYSTGGTVQAALEILKGNIDNAFVFTSVGDHHAGRNFFGGWCYLNGAAAAIAVLRERGVRRFAIVDTDSHHADGTRDIFGWDKEVLHVCFCFQDYCDENGNVDIAIPHGISDESYVKKMEQEFASRTINFRPEFIFWELGYDATRGEYGDKGIGEDCHWKLARIIKETADAVCQGRLVTILCGGSSRQLATYIIPRVIKRLAELD